MIPSSLSNGALNNFQFTNDPFTDKDVCSIVLEVPNSALGTKVLAFGLELLTAQAAAGFRQIVARAEAFAICLPSRDERDAYLAAGPADDASFIAVFAHSLEHTAHILPRKHGG